MFLSFKGTSKSFTAPVFGLAENLHGFTTSHSRTLFPSSSQTARKSKNTKKECMPNFSDDEKLNSKLSQFTERNIRPLILPKKPTFLVGISILFFPRIIFIKLFVFQFPLQFFLLFCKLLTNLVQFNKFIFQFFLADRSFLHLLCRDSFHYVH